MFYDWWSNLDHFFAMRGLSTTFFQTLIILYFINCIDPSCGLNLWLKMIRFWRWVGRKSLARSLGVNFLDFGFIGLWAWKWGSKKMRFFSLFWGSSCQKWRFFIKSLIFVDLGGFWPFLAQSWAKKPGFWGVFGLLARILNISPFLGKSKGIRVKFGSENGSIFGGKNTQKRCAYGGGYVSVTFSAFWGGVGRV